MLFVATWRYIFLFHCATYTEHWHARIDHLFISLPLFSMALNFDEYTKGWGSIGTSMPSDAKDSRDKY